MEIKLKNNNNKFEELKDGDVFIAKCRDINEEFVAMKIPTTEYGEHLIFDLENLESYSDIYNYEIVRLIDCDLVEK